MGKKTTALLVLLCTACTDNPLIGEWVLENKRLAKSGFVCNDIEFTSTQEICDGLVMGVKYEVIDDSVIITPDTENQLLKFGIKIRVESNGRISYIDPLSKKNIFYSRRGSTANPRVVKVLLESYTKAELETSCKEGIEGALATSGGSREDAEKAVNVVCTAAALK